MKIFSISDDEARRSLGETGPGLLHGLQDAMTRWAAPAWTPTGVDPTRLGHAITRYGRSGAAIHILQQIWTKAPWREREGMPEPSDNEVIRFSRWEQVSEMEESRIWNQSLLAAGFRSQEPELALIWSDSSKIGEEIGGHGGRFLAGAMTGELYRLSQGTDVHFFLDMLPWVLRGHWPCGWDDRTNRLIVF